MATTKITIRRLTTYLKGGKSVSQNTPGAVKTESSNWYLFGRDLTGKQIRKATGTSDYAEAEQQAKRLEVDLSRGAATADNLKSLRYEDLREDYVLENPDRTKSHQLKLIDTYFKSIKVPAFENHIKRFIKERRAAGISDSTIKRNLRPLVAMTNLAAKRGRIPRAPYFPELKDGEPREGFIEADVFTKLRDALACHLQPLMTFCYYTGWRIGAARQITWGMVNRPECTEISIPGRITKTKKPQTLPLVGPLGEVSALLKKMFKEKSEDGSIRLRTDSDLLFDATNLRKEWNKAVAAVGLGTYDEEKGTRTGLTIHDFRRSAARNLRKAGVDEATAMKVTGHKTNSMFKRYAITSDDDTKEALIKLGDYTKGRMAAAQN